MYLTHTSVRGVGRSPRGTEAARGSNALMQTRRRKAPQTPGAEVEPARISRADAAVIPRGGERGRARWARARAAHVSHEHASKLRTTSHLGLTPMDENRFFFIKIAFIVVDR